MAGEIWRGFRQTVERIRRMIERLRSPVTPVQEFARYMLASVDHNFQAQGRPARWTPLAESTARQRGSSEPILQREGNLRGSFFAEFPGTGFAIRSSSAIFPFHQLGTRNMAARIILLFQDEDLLVGERIFKRHLQW